MCFLNFIFTFQTIKFFDQLIAFKTLVELFPTVRGDFNEGYASYWALYTANSFS